MNNSVIKSINRRDNSMSKNSLSNYSNKGSFNEHTTDLLQVVKVNIMTPLHKMVKNFMGRVNKEQF